MKDHVTVFVNPGEETKSLSSCSIDNDREQQHSEYLISWNSVVLQYGIVVSGATKRSEVGCFAQRVFGDMVTFWPKAK